MRWTKIALLILLGLGLGGCLPTLQVSRPQPYDSDIARDGYRRSDEIPTPQAFGLQFGLQDIGGEP